MVGGIVEEVLNVEGRVAMAILVRGVEEDKNKLLGVNVRGHHNIEAGDTVWWQGPYVLWTPADKSRQDVKLSRVGYAYPAELFYAMKSQSAD